MCNARLALDTINLWLTTTERCYFASDARTYTHIFLQHLKHYNGNSRLVVPKAPILQKKKKKKNSFSVSTFAILIHYVISAEHMLFYASEKYPDEDSYSKYISEVKLFIVFRDSWFFLLILLFIYDLFLWIHSWNSSLFVSCGIFQYWKKYQELLIRNMCLLIWGEFSTSLVLEDSMSWCIFPLCQRVVDS